MKSWWQWMQGRGGKGRDKCSWLLSRWGPFSLFLPLFPAPPFPLIAVSASDHNLLEKKKIPEQAVPPLHQPLLMERSSDRNLEGFFSSSFWAPIYHTNGLTLNHMGKYIPGVKLLWLFPKIYSQGRRRRTGYGRLCSENDFYKWICKIKCRVLFKHIMESDHHGSWYPYPWASPLGVSAQEY